MRRHQINIDDTDDTDVLPLFMPAIAFIQAELDKGRGVLVHCQAGMSETPFHFFLVCDGTRILIGSQLSQAEAQPLSQRT